MVEVKSYEMLKRLNTIHKLNYPKCSHMVWPHRLKKKKLLSCWPCDNPSPKGIYGLEESPLGECGQAILCLRCDLQGSQQAAEWKHEIPAKFQSCSLVRNFTSFLLRKIAMLFQPGHILESSGELFKNTRLPFSTDILAWIIQCETQTLTFFFILVILSYSQVKGSQR